MILERIFKKELFRYYPKCYFCSIPFENGEKVLLYLPIGTSKNKWDKYFKEEIVFDYSKKKAFHKECWLSFEPEKRRKWMELDFTHALDVPYNSSICKTYKIIYEDEKNKNEIIPNKHKHLEFWYEEDISDTEANKVGTTLWKSCLNRILEKEKKITFHDIERKCPTCHKTFFPNLDSQEYCSIECVPKPIIPEEKKPQFESRKCEWCGKIFPISRSNRKYCSGECYEKSHYLKRKEKGYWKTYNRKKRCNS